MVRRSPVINVMVRAADRAARGLKRDFGEVSNLQVSRKGPADFVSTADFNAERTIRFELGKARPEYGFLMEESGAHPAEEGCDRRWIVDPLDGTLNFLHGLPHFSISIALEEAGEVIAGVVYDPVKEDLFFAEKGIGAYHNDRRMRVSGREYLAEALIATGIPDLTKPEGEAFAEEFSGMIKHNQPMRRMGSAALDLAYVAAGRFDGFWDRGLDAWDIAAGALLVREAGGYVTAVDGKPLDLEGREVLAANSSLHRPLSKQLMAARSSDQTAKAAAD